MTSLLTNTAAMSALQSLTATQRQVSTTQAQVSSGLSVANASDNAAYWSIGKTMSAQVAGLGAVQQGLSLTKSIADVTAAALGSIKDSLDRIQADVVAAQQSGVSLPAVQADISARQQSIIAVANSASFNGVNWLINKTLSSSSVTTVYNIGVSRTDYEKILSSQNPDVSSNFDSTVTTKTSDTQNGENYSQTDISEKMTILSDAHDGTLSRTAVSNTTTRSGDSNLPRLSNLTIPTSMSSDGGLIDTELSLVPLTLFSDGASAYTDETDVYYQGVLDPTQSSPSSTFTNNGQSYRGYATSASSGILDTPIQIFRQVTYGPSLPGTTQTVIGLDDSGGAAYTVTSGSSGGSYTQVTNESVLTFNVIGMSRSEIMAAGQAVQTSIAGIINASGVIGGLQTQISNMQTFNSSLSDALTSGIGSLVDADMNVASTRLQALQTQQQLGIQSLSMANNNGQLILKLFQAA